MTTHNSRYLILSTFSLLQRFLATERWNSTLPTTLYSVSNIPENLTIDPQPCLWFPWQLLYRRKHCSKHKHIFAAVTCLWAIIPQGGEIEGWLVWYITGAEPCYQYVALSVLKCIHHGRETCPVSTQLQLSLLNALECQENRSFRSLLWTYVDWRITYRQTDRYLPRGA